MGEYTEKHRLLHEETVILTAQVGNSGGPTSETITNVPLRAYEVVRSKGNLRSKSELGSEDLGSDFKLRRLDFKYEWYGTTAMTSSFFSTVFWHYGPVWCNRFPTSFGPVPGVIPTLPNSTDLVAKGTKAIALVSPTSPRASLSQTLVELKREGLPTALPSFPKKGASGAGGDYLNVQFGWLPLVSDVKSIANSVINMEQYLKRFREHANRPLKRRFNFPVVTSERFFTPFTPVQQGNHYGQVQNTTFFGIEEIEEEIWFSGSFQYGYPIGDSQMAQLARAAVDARYIIGLDFTPATIWNLIPWSWLADWFGNVGDVLANLSDNMYNQQVLRYGYVMRKRTVHNYYETRGFYRGSERWAQLNTWDHTKERVRATPYGFGLTWSGFSPYQVSILAALGLSNRRG